MFEAEFSSVDTNEAPNCEDLFNRHLRFDNTRCRNVKAYENPENVETKHLQNKTIQFTCSKPQRVYEPLS